MLFSRRRPTQFLEDAAWLGVPEEAAFSRAELRHRRDQLMAVHHPDHGGDAASAARINETYSRMVAWLDRREARALAIKRPVPDVAAVSSATTHVKTRAAKIAGAAAFAFATFVALRSARKR
jgi:hypothetical protein